TVKGSASPKVVSCRGWVSADLSPKQKKAVNANWQSRLNKGSEAFESVMHETDSQHSNQRV
ncbi:hypothetical protein QCD79_27135, partial [Pseudomonas quasicaspiana]|nr:hypothetical protein [Pseudomonas quasicaspiana]